MITFVWMKSCYVVYVQIWVYKKSSTLQLPYFKYVLTHSNKTRNKCFFYKFSYWFYQNVQTFSYNLTPTSWLYLSYIWRYDILWSKPFNFFTEVQCAKMMVKVYILHQNQYRKILRIHHLMHKTIINPHQNISVASIVFKDYRNTKTSNLTF